MSCSIRKFPPNRIAKKILLFIKRVPEKLHIWRVYISSSIRLLRVECHKQFFNLSSSSFLSAILVDVVVVVVVDVVATKTLEWDPSHFMPLKLDWSSHVQCVQRTMSLFQFSPHWRNLFLNLSFTFPTTTTTMQSGANVVNYCLMPWQMCILKNDTTYSGGQFTIQQNKYFWLRNLTEFIRVSL